MNQVLDLAFGRRGQPVATLPATSFFTPCVSAWIRVFVQTGGGVFFAGNACRHKGEPCRYGFHMLVWKHGGIAQATKLRSRVTSPGFMFVFPHNFRSRLTSMFWHFSPNFRVDAVVHCFFGEGSKASSFEFEPRVPLPSSSYLPGRSWNL